MILVPSLKGKAVAVMGLGKSGAATARALMASGAGVIAWDDDEGARKVGAEAAVPIADLMVKDLSRAALVVWSPGIPHTWPTPHPVAERARSLNVPVMCDVELLALAKPKAHFLAVSGTNGKSTTTTLLAHVLAECGRDTAAGGNLGIAALDMPDLGDDGRYVLELSSYQLELVDTLSLEVAVLLNITPDHVDRHGGMEGYVASKHRLFRQLKPHGVAVIGVDDEHCRAIADAVEATGRKVVRISAERKLDQGVSAHDGVLYEDGRAIADLKDIDRLPGRHNWQNACAVFAAARADGIGAEAAMAALKTYPGLGHRQELVAEIDDVLYVNDSKATNADAAEKALVCYDKVYWIVGGQAKEGGIAPLEQHFGRVVHAFLIGEATEAFAATLTGKVPFTRCGTLDKAVAAARNLAVSDRHEGAVVLLSPACASWDQFKSFEHRGETFREIVDTIPGRRRQ